MSGAEIDYSRSAQRRELAGIIARQAQEIADGRVIGPEHGAVVRLVENAKTLEAWIIDDYAPEHQHQSTKESARVHTGNWRMLENEWLAILNEEGQSDDALES